MTEKEKIKSLIDRLYKTSDLEDDELLYLLDNIDEEGKKYLFSKSKEVRDRYYGNRVYLRGLIEFSNYCRRECRYCGINAFNQNVKRYRMSKDEIIETCIRGKEMGFQTFVLQGGEDTHFSTQKMAEIVKSIKEVAPESAITLSIGERPYNDYKVLKASGADRFLLRHETMNSGLYRKLHPYSQLETRVECLKNLKSLGYQTGTGFMAGLPEYTNSDYVSDLRFIKEFNPEMVGMGPFIPHKDTSMKDCERGELDTVIVLLSIIRLLSPKVLLPATTALSSIGAEGRKRGLDVGCNVIMPNLTPLKYRGEYTLYNNKKITGSESADELMSIKNSLKSIGYVADMSRGDSLVK